MTDWGGYLTAEEKIVVVVIEFAIREEGPRYLLDPCGRYWMSIAGLDYRATFARATEKGTRWEGIPYMPYKTCRGHRLLKKKDVAA